VSWGTHGGQSPSSGGIRWHSPSGNDISVILVPAGQRPFGAAHAKRPQQDSNLRSRLRSPAVRSSEFVHPTCLDSIAHLAGCRDHSAYIPDHETSPTARTVQGMARVRSGQARPGPWFLTGVAAEVSRSGASSRVHWSALFRLCWLSGGQSRAWGWRGGHVHSAGHPRI